MRKIAKAPFRKLPAGAVRKQRRAQARRRGTRRTEKCGLAILVQSRGSVLQLFVYLGSQVMKSLEEIGFEHYYHAEQTGWVLYLEGSTDLAILRAFAPKTRP